MKKFKYTLGLILIISHLVVIFSLILLKLLGGYDMSEFSTLIAIIIPTFAGYTTSIIMFIVKDKYKTKNKTDKPVTTAFKFLSLLFPISLTICICISIWLQGFNLAFDNFEDFKHFILIVQSLFSIYSGYLIYTIFDKSKT